MADDGSVAEKQCGLGTFYRALQQREGVVSPLPLVGTWDADRVEAIKKAVQEAFVKGEIKGRVIPDFATAPSGRTRTNQSKGNVAASFIVDRLNQHADGLRIGNVSGPGYPDKRVVLADGFACACELKATSTWNEYDGNRRVLTSASAKLRGATAKGRLSSPPCHLILTVLYDADEGTVQSVRLDFLEPASLVNVRLEASTSHALLHNGQHVSQVIS